MKKPQLARRAVFFAKDSPQGSAGMYSFNGRPSLMMACHPRRWCWSSVAVLYIGKPEFWSSIKYMACSVTSQVPCRTAPMNTIFWKGPCMRYGSGIARQNSFWEWASSILSGCPFTAISKKRSRFCAVTKTKLIFGFSISTFQFVNLCPDKLIPEKVGAHYVTPHTSAEIK